MLLEFRLNEEIDRRLRSRPVLNFRQRWSQGGLEGPSSKGSDLGTSIAPKPAGSGIGAMPGIGADVGASMSNIFWTRGKDLELHLGSTMDISLDQALRIPVKGSR